MKKVLKFLAFSSLFVVASCGKKDDPDPVTPTTQVAKTMFVNGCVSSEPLKVSLNDVAVTSVNGITYLTNTSYLDMAPATQVRTSFILQSSNLKLSEVNQDYVANTYYTAFAAGTITNPSMFITTDDLTPPATNMAKVRFVNLSSDNLNETVYVGSNKIDSNVTYKESTAFAQVNAGTYNVIVQDPNNVPDSRNLDQQTFAAGKIYTIMLTGTRSGTGTSGLNLKMISNN